MFRSGERRSEAETAVSLPSAATVIRRASITAVFLDADGVVQRPASGWRPVLEAACGGSDRLSDFMADLLAAEDACLCGEADFPTHLEEVMARWSAQEFADSVMDSWNAIQTDQAVLELVRRLRGRGIYVALATNQQTLRAKNMKGLYEAEFDELFFSCEIGHAKPDCSYFQSILSRSGFPAQSALFIDDRELNVISAKSCGMHAEVFHLDQGHTAAAELLRLYGLPIV